MVSAGTGRKWFATLLCVGMVAAGNLVIGTSAHAEVKVTESTKYYSVNGRTGLELGKAMLVGGGKTIRLRHAIAATATKFNVTDPELVVENGRCKIRKLRVNLGLTYYYPKWSGRSKASPSVRKAWDVFYQELVKHEKTHGKIAIEYANRLEKELLRTSGTVLARCADFTAVASFRVRSLANELKRKQADFDRREGLSSSRISKLQVQLIKTR
ncbi:MAG: DUF922 domain-containing protein [Nitratireductor sp.]|nr:DUF922 domain-containing protein [Nitratireductor sp.]